MSLPHIPICSGQRRHYRRRTQGISRAMTINTNIGLCVKACGGDRSQAVVLMTIVELSGRGARRAAFTRESLSERCGIPKSTIGKYVNALRKRDLIETQLAPGPDCDSHSICIWAALTDKAWEALHIPGSGS